MFAGLKVCEFVASHGALSSLVSEIPRYPLTPDIRVPYTGADKDALLDEAAAKLAGYQPNRIDGVRLEFADGWGMIARSTCREERARLAASLAGSFIQADIPAVPAACSSPR